MACDLLWHVTLFM